VGGSAAALTALHPRPCLYSATDVIGRKEREKNYAFWRQFIEKPSIIPGCPGQLIL